MKTNFVNNKQIDTIFDTKQQKLEKYLTEEVKSGQNLFVTKYFQNGISSFDHSAA